MLRFVLLFILAGALCACSGEAARPSASSPVTSGPVTSAEDPLAPPYRGYRPLEQRSIATPVGETETVEQIFWWGQYCRRQTFHIRMSDGTTRTRVSTPHNCSNTRT